MRQWFIITVACICYTSFAHTQWVVDSSTHREDPQFQLHTRNGIEHIYNLSFDSARTEFQKLIQLQSDHPAGYFFLAMVEWWNIAIDIDNESNDEKLFSLLDKTIDVCDKRLDKDDNDLSALFFKGGAVGYRARLHANRDSWLKAANDGRIALPIAQKSYQLAPNNYDILLGMGIYNYYAATIPEQYPVVKPLMIFFPGGDKEKGIKQLRKASEKATYANIEASYFLLQILYNYEKDFQNSLQIAEKLFKQFPNNVIFHRYVGRCNASLGNWNVMHKTCLDILERVHQNKLGYNASTEREAQYYLGIHEMTFGNNLDEALKHFYRCDELSRTIDIIEQSGYMIMANIKIGNIYDVQSNRDHAVKQYRKVLKMTAYQDSRDQAEMYIKTPYKRP